MVLAGVVLAYGSIGPAEGAEAFNPLALSFPLTRALTTAVAMFFGILGNAVWCAANRVSEDEEVRLLGLVWSALRSVGLIKASLVSPLVFASVYALTKTEPDPVVAHLLAFQNGFFWESVLENR